MGTQALDKTVEAADGERKCLCRWEGGVGACLLGTYPLHSNHSITSVPTYYEITSGP